MKLLVCQLMIPTGLLRSENFSYMSSRGIETNEVPIQLFLWALLIRIGDCIR
uniref:Uncharacterized protein n=1 Tax=Rhizophora mucronata TaxID=61149 RepID=A0A2P2IYU3_RHIMU